MVTAEPLGHPQVEDDGVRPMELDELAGGLPILRLADDLEPAIALELGPDDHANVGLVVDDDDRQHCCFLPHVARLRALRQMSGVHLRCVAGPE